MDNGFDGNATPKYLQVALYIRNYIKNGCLTPGAKLPGGRKFADIFGVSKSTVYEAMSHLQSEGIIDISSQSGAYVAMDAWHDLAAESPSWEKYVNSGWQKSIGHRFKELCRFIGNDSDIYLSSTALDSGFNFNSVLSDALDDVSSNIRAENTLKAYNAKGPFALRRAVSEHLLSKGLDITPENIIITPSSSIAFDVICRGLLNSGNVAYISENLSAYSFVILNSLGVEIVPVPVDQEGMSVSELKKLVKSPKRPIIITSPCQPGYIGETMSKARREELIVFCRSARYPIIELDSTSDLNPEAPKPLKALDRNNNVIYIGSIPVYMSLGFNVGWIVAPEHLSDRLIDILAQSYHYPFNLNYNLVERLLSGGCYNRFLKTFIPSMNKRMKFVDGLLERYVSPFAKWNKDARYGLFQLILDSPETVRKIAEANAGILFVTDIKLKNTDDTSIYVFTCGLSEDKLYCGLEILGRLLYQCSIPPLNCQL